MNDIESARVLEFLGTLEDCRCLDLLHRSGEFPSEGSPDSPPRPLHAVLHNIAKETNKTEKCVYPRCTRTPHIRTLPPHFHVIFMLGHKGPSKNCLKDQDSLIYMYVQSLAPTVSFYSPWLRQWLWLVGIMRFIDAGSPPPKFHTKPSTYMYSAMQIFWASRSNPTGCRSSTGYSLSHMPYILSLRHLLHTVIGSLSAWICWTWKQ